MYSKIGYMQYLSLPSVPVPKLQICGNRYSFGMVSKIRHHTHTCGTLTQKTMGFAVPMLFPTHGAQRHMADG